MRTKSNQDVINFPVARTGSVIKASSKLNQSQSQEVLEYFQYKVPNQFTSLISSCLQKYNANHVIKSSDHVELEDGEQLILKFPIYNMSLDSFECEVRLSLTVCKGQRSSKVWTRISMRQYQNCPATKIGLETTERFFATVEPVMRCINSNTIEVYKKSLGKLRIADELSEKYAFSMRGLNSTDSHLDLILGSISDGKIANLESALKNNRHAFQAFLPLFEITQRPYPKKPNDMLNIARSADHYLSFLENRYNDRVVRTVSITKPEEKMATINCICYNSGDHMPDHSPADIASAALIRHYASTL